MNAKKLLVDFIEYAKSRHVMPILHSNIEPLIADYLACKNNGKSNVMGWVATPTIPDYDGQYLVQIEEKQECGNVWKFQKVVECFCAMWVLEENQEITHWMLIEPPPIA